MLNECVMTVMCVTLELASHTPSVCDLQLVCDTTKIDTLDSDATEAPNWLQETTIENPYINMGWVPTSLKTPLAAPKRDPRKESIL